MPYLQRSHFYDILFAGQKDMKRFKRPGIGNSRMRPADEPDGNGKN